MPAASHHEKLEAYEATLPLLSSKVRSTFAARGRKMVETHIEPDGSSETFAKRPRWRRAVTLLRQRDWTGIAIELLVVTLGVLLAFQIDQWAQDRRQAREERQFLERMWHETAESVEETDWVMTMHARYRSEFIDGYRALDDPSELARLADTPNVGCRARVFPGLGFNPTAFQELSASGRLNIISDPQLRAELRDVVAAQADAEANRQNTTEIASRTDEGMSPYYRSNLDSDGNNHCKVDWSQLARDPLAPRLMARGAFGHALMWKKYAYVRDKLVIAHNRLACILGKSDCRKAVPVVLQSPPRSPYITPDIRADIDKSARAYNVD